MDNNNEMINSAESFAETTPEVQNAQVVTAKKPFPIWAIVVCVAVVLAVIVTAVILLIPRYDTYTITVIDEIGNPASNVMVTITDKKGDSKTRITDTSGVLVFDEVLVGNNTVTVEKGLSKYVIITESYTLEKNSNTLRVLVRDEARAQNIYGVVPDGTVAYGVTVGSYNLPTTAGNTSYVVFTAYQSGIYKVSFVSDDMDMTVGYYGIPMFVQNSHCGDLDYDGKSFELIIQDTATPYVIGVNCVNTTDALLTIERVDDAPFDPGYVDWTVVEIDREPEKCDLGGKKLVDVDITKSSINLTVENGFYYIDGKPVYIRITTTTTYGSYNDELQFVPVVNGSLALLAGFVDDMVGINIGGHVYDENGKFVAKYLYNDIIGKYMECVDDKYGVVPLTEQLADCIKLHGAASGWFDPDKPGYLFNDIKVNDEISWLFLCMTE